MQILLLLSSVLLAFTSLACKGENQRHGTLDIQYTVFPSTIIPAEVAQAHAITRADNRIIVNVSLKENELPATAQIKGEVINLLDQVVTLDFVEVRESDAVYYLATHISLPVDILRFNLLVTPFHSEPVPITFMHRYE